LPVPYINVALAPMGRETAILVGCNDLSELGPREAQPITLAEGRNLCSTTTPCQKQEQTRATVSACSFPQSWACFAVQSLLLPANSPLVQIWSEPVGQLLLFPALHRPCSRPPTAPGLRCRPIRQRDCFGMPWAHHSGDCGEHIGAGELTKVLRQPI